LTGYGVPAPARLGTEGMMSHSRKTAKESIVFAIGNPRSGTTWLFRQLLAHPRVHVPHKGLHYFESSYTYKKTTLNFRRGEAWYLSRFRPAPGQIPADVCHAYFSDKDACARMRAFNPRARIVITLRNPYEAVYSHYRQLLKIYNLKKGFLELIGENPHHFLESSLVHRHLSRFLSAFPRENLKICLYDDLKEDPAAYARGIYAFLGVDPGFVSPHLHEKINQRRSVRSVRLRNLQSAATEAVRSRPRLYAMVNWFYDHVIPRRVVWKIQALNYGSENLYHTLNKDEIRLLEDFYHKDLERFLAMPEFRHLDWGSHAAGGSGRPVCESRRVVGQDA